MLPLTSGVVVVGSSEPMRPPSSSLFDGVEHGIVAVNRIIVGVVAIRLFIAVLVLVPVLPHGNMRIRVAAVVAAVYLEVRTRTLHESVNVDRSLPCAASWQNAQNRPLVCVLLLLRFSSPCCLMAIAHPGYCNRIFSPGERKEVRMYLVPLQLFDCCLMLPYPLTHGC